VQEPLRRAQTLQLLQIISIILTAISILAGGIFSFSAYSLPESLLLPAPYRGWTVFITAAGLWCVGLVCAIIAHTRRRSAVSRLALALAVLAPVLVISLATAVFLIALNDHPFVF
jgi:hypothetical protein